MCSKFSNKFELKILPIYNIIVCSALLARSKMQCKNKPKHHNRGAVQCKNIWYSRESPKMCCIVVLLHSMFCLTWFVGWAHFRCCALRCWWWSSWLCSPACNFDQRRSANLESAGTKYCTTTRRGSESHNWKWKF